MKKKSLFITVLILLFCIEVYSQVISEISIRCKTKNTKAQEYFNLGNLGLRINQLENARELFIAAVKLDSTFCDAWDNLSICYRKMGKYKDAFNAGLYSVMLDSTNAIAWINCGYASYLNNNTYEALTSFNHLQSIIPNNPEGYYGESMVLYSIDRISEARVNIYKAEYNYKINNIKTGKEFDLLKGFIEYKSGNKKEAQYLFENIYSDFKDNAELNYFLGICYLDNENNQKKSQKYINKAIKLGYVIVKK